MSGVRFATSLGPISPNSGHSQMDSSNLEHRRVHCSVPTTRLGKEYPEPVGVEQEKITVGSSLTTGFAFIHVRVLRVNKFKKFCEDLNVQFSATTASCTVRPCFGKRYLQKMATLDSRPRTVEPASVVSGEQPPKLQRIL